MRAVRVVVIQSTIQFILIFLSGRCLIVQRVLAGIMIEAVPGHYSNGLPILVRYSDNRWGRRGHLIQGLLLHGV